MNKFDVLRCTQGSMTSFDPLTPENFPKYAEEGLTYEEAAKIFSEAGLSIEKVVVDPKRSIQKIVNKIWGGIIKNDSKTNRRSQKDFAQLV